MLKGLIFDFDGLILDTETPIFEAWQKVYRQYGCDLPFDLWISTVGTSEAYFEPVQYLHSISQATINDAELKRFYSQFENDLIAREEILPGIKDLIIDAYNKGLKLAIASSSPLSWVLNYSKKLGIDHYFSCFATKDEVKFTKPHPDLYRLALNKLNLDHKEVVALEDSLHGIHAARQAGIFTIAIPANLTLNLDFSVADITVPNASAISLDDINERLTMKWEIQ